MRRTRQGQEKSTHDCQRDSHATSHTAIYANITQTGSIRVYRRWFWVVLVGFVGGCGWFWLALLLVLVGFGWFRVLVTTLGKYTKQKVHNNTLQGFATFWFFAAIFQGEIILRET